jgi:methionyl-tRNA formyltransferase
VSVAPEWWRKPRRVSVVVDNPSWVLPHAQALCAKLEESGDTVSLVRDSEQVPMGEVAFYLGCVRIAPKETLRRNRRNLVVHASDLPKDRGFSPWSWSILRGQDRIPVCLLNAEAEVDSGAVIYKDWIAFEGHELVDELRAKIGAAHVFLCARFMAEREPPAGTPQAGEPSWVERRRPSDSALDPDRSLAEQFSLLRVVDNEKYPAFFELKGQRYILTIRKAERG